MPVPVPVPVPGHFAPPGIVRVLAGALVPAPVQSGNFAPPGAVETAAVAQRPLLAGVPVRLAAAAAAAAPAVVAQRRCIRLAAGAGFDRPA